MRVKAFLTVFLGLATIVSLSLGGFIPMAGAQLGPTHGEATDVSLQDSNSDGKMDLIVVTIYNEMLNTWQAFCAPDAACGFTVTQNSNPVDVTNVSIEYPATAAPAVFVQLDPNDLMIDTDGVNNNPIEITYTPGGDNCGTTAACIYDPEGVAEMLVIRSGDSDTALGSGYSCNREDDNASPIVRYSSPADGDEGVSVKKTLVYDFSEPMFPQPTLTFGNDYYCWPDGDGPSTPSTWSHSWTNENRRLQISHEEPFDLDVWYTCQLSGSGFTPTGFRIAGVLVGLYDASTEPNQFNFFQNAFLTGVVASGGAELPKNMSVEINEGAAETETTVVALSLWADYSPEMMISNSSTFSGAVWEPFSTSKEWTLTSGGGEKTVYVKYRNVEKTESETVTDTILLLGEPAADDGSGDDGSDMPAPFMDFTDGRFIRTANNPAVYFLDRADVRHVYVHYNVWHSYFGDDWSRIEIVTDDEMAGYSLGDNVPFKTGSLMKIPTNPKVYEVANYYMIHWVVDEAVAAARYGAGWASLIYDLPVGFFGDYVEGEPLES